MGDGTLQIRLIITACHFETEDANCDRATLLGCSDSAWFDSCAQFYELCVIIKRVILCSPDVVRTAINKGVRLAHHVDIGVAHWRASEDLDWLDWLVTELGGSEISRRMHVEAIVWAALARRIGGGHLDPG
jgi:hypothetical protein